MTTPRTLYHRLMEPVSNTPVDPALAARVVAALERAPQVAVPTDFAARVVASFPAPQPVRRRASLGRLIALVAGTAGVAAMLALAPHAAPSFSSLAFDGELLLLVELASIGGWIAIQTREG